MIAGTTRLAMQGSSVMAWIFLLLAGVLEVVWAFLMKASDGFSKPWPTIGTIAFMIVSFGLTPMRIGGVVLIVSGLVVLKLSSSH